LGGRRTNRKESATNKFMSFPRKKFSKKKMGTTMSGNASGSKATTATTQNKANYNILQQFNAEQQQQSSKPPPPQLIVKSPHEKCKDILDELSNLEKDVESFEGVKNDKAYLKLEELLTRCLLKLDEIDRGDEQINMNRKNLINFTHTLTEKLEVIATANLANKGSIYENTVATLNQNTKIDPNEQNNANENGTEKK
jgi:hypothetical protein